MTRGAIFEVPAQVLILALKAVGALPADAECLVAFGHGQEGKCVLVRAESLQLPKVLDGQTFPRRIAEVGNRWGGCEIES